MNYGDIQAIDGLSIDVDRYSQTEPLKNLDDVFTQTVRLWSRGILQNTKPVISVEAHIFLSEKWLQATQKKGPYELAHLCTVIRSHGHIEVPVFSFDPGLVVVN